MGRMKYVQRRSGRFEFRYPMPDDLAGQYVPTNWPSSLAALVNSRTARIKTELVRSLGTADRRVAEQKALGHIAEAHSLVDNARRALRSAGVTTVPRDQVALLALQHKIRLLSMDDATRKRGLGVDLVDPTRLPTEEGMTEEDLRAYAFLIDYLDQDARDQSARMRPSDSVGLVVNAAVEEAGFDLPPDSPSWRELELAFLRAQCEAFDAIKERPAGEHVPTPVLAPANSPLGETITVALKRWAEAGGRGAKQRGKGVRSEAERAVRLFVELHGDLPLSLITKAHGRSYRDALARLPKALPARLSKKALPDILRENLTAYPSRSAQTVNKTLAVLAGIFARADRDGFFDPVAGWSNPFHIRYEIAAAHREPYEPFSAAELTTLFASPVHAAGERPRGGRSEAAYWLPLIALFSGGRRTEIAQLRIRDLRQSSEGIWFIDISNQGEGQSLKNVGSARSVPVHAELIRLGLLDYHRSRTAAAAADSALWVGFDIPVEPKAKAWSKWFARYLGTHVVESRAKTFHSFRHTFKRGCREAGLYEEYHNAMTGHSGGNETVVDPAIFPAP